MVQFNDSNNSQYRTELIITPIDRDIDGNRTKIRRTLALKKLNPNDGGYWTLDNQSWSLSTSGLPTQSGSFKYDFRGSTVKQIYQDEVWISHNADGTKTISVSASVQMDSPPGGTGTPSGSVTLTAIPRASQPTVGGTLTVAASSGSLAIQTNRASSSFTHTITWKIGSRSGTVATGVGTSTTWTLDATERSQILNELNDVVSGTGTITCKTYSGSTLVGTKTVNFKVAVASSVVPVVTGITLNEAVAAVASGVGAFVQNQTRLAFAITGAAGVYGSTIESYELKIAGQTFKTQSGTTAKIASSGTVTATATVTDSRGRTASYSRTITVLAWAVPQITSFKVQRATASGALDDDGTRFRFTVVAKVSSLSVGGVQKNKLQYQAKVKGRGSTSWTSSALTTHTSTSLSAWFVISGTYSEILAWDARFEVRDLFTASSPSAAQTVVGVAAMLMQLAKNGIGIGKVWEKGALDVRGDAFATRLWLAGTGDVSLSSTGHPFQIGDAASQNLAVDGNEIQSRNNGAASGLMLNGEGGNVTVGDSDSVISIPGQVSNPNLPYAYAAGRLTSTTVIAAGGARTQTVTLPAGKFSVVPIIQLTPRNAARLTVAVLDDETTSGFSVQIDNHTDGNAAPNGVNWTATQMKASSASG